MASSCGCNVGRSNTVRHRGDSMAENVFKPDLWALSLPAAAAHHRDPRILPDSKRPGHTLFEIDGS